MRSRILSFFLCFLFTPVLISFSPLLFADESMTLTTYYPSPYGSYNDLYVANTLGVGTSSAVSKVQVVTTSDTHGGVVTWDSRFLVVGATGNSGGISLSYNQSTNTGVIQGVQPNVGWRNVVINPNAGSVGIGTTAPTAKLEVGCPPNFTNVKGGTGDAAHPINQLGCMETAEHGTTTSWTTANNACFAVYGGRLPTFVEWRTAVDNFTLTNETNDQEWLGDAQQLSGSVYVNLATDGAGNVNYIGVDSFTSATSHTYRCWIPR